MAKATAAQRGLPALGTETGRLYVSLYFPALALDHWLRASQENYPLALYSGQRVVAVSSAARAAGVAEGMSVTSALALSPQLCLRVFEPEQGLHLLQNLAQWAYGFTPYVELDEPDFLHLEVASSLRLFHGQAMLLERMAQELSAWRCGVFIGLGPTRMVAKLLAKNQAVEAAPSLAEQQTAIAEQRLGVLLSALPVSRLDVSAALLKRLASAGFRQLGQLMALPLRELGQRFGKDAVAYLQLLCGQQEKPVSALALAPAFNQRLAFIYGLTDVAHLQEPLQVLLRQLQQFLRQRQLITQRICWCFCHEDKTQSQIIVAVQSAHSDTDEFYQLTGLKLENLSWSSAIAQVGLEALGLTSAAPVAKGLFRDMRDKSDDIERLINRFYQRFSAQQFYSYKLQAEYLPDRQQCQQLAFVSNKTKASSAVDLEVDHWLCPWLLHPPQALLMREKKLMWYSDGQRQELELMSRAVRFDSHWWQQRARRDYFIAKARQHYYSVFFCQQRRQWFMAGFYVC
ncbi:DNA polymerase Y family protein [Simiduia curdlanivorans]|uniref:Y-family DNA polymerase n=1 Tax=Simiduia curdlanivorans TaxID=1492769 RepID=A0ABV8V8N6_9GAMM|nr:DNA polymerase Y family protein [Simiduia curdlanivorans]MDN3639390.1 DNA polymerase Y family protein [Simiduia curdlanivorans]